MLKELTTTAGTSDIASTDVVHGTTDSDRSGNGRSEGDKNSSDSDIIDTSPTTQTLFRSVSQF